MSAGRLSTASEFFIMARGEQMPTIEILVPCYNEEAVLEKFYERVSKVLDGINGCEFRYIFVNDGSTDGTLVCGVSRCRR